MLRSSSSVRLWLKRDKLDMGSGGFFLSILAFLVVSASVTTALFQLDDELKESITCPHVANDMVKWATKKGTASLFITSNQVSARGLSSFHPIHGAGLKS